MMKLLLTLLLCVLSALAVRRTPSGLLQLADADEVYYTYSDYDEESESSYYYTDYDE
jgi:hypothetical protein